MAKPKIIILNSDSVSSTVFVKLLRDRFSVKCLSYDGVADPTQEEIRKNMQGVFGIICSPPFRIKKEIIEAAGDTLKVVCTQSSGYDHLDVEGLKSKGIKIGYEGTSQMKAEVIAEYAVGLLLSVSRRIAYNYHLFRKIETYWDCRVSNIQHSLFNSVVGIIGCGRIGIAVAKILKSFQTKKLLYFSRSQKPDVEAIGGEFRSVDRLCKESDFIVVTAALNKETRCLINKERLNSMKSNAILINVARGELIDTKALIEVLKNKKIAGAGLDVVHPEPVETDDPLRTLDNVVVTPHIAWFAQELQPAMQSLLVENLIAVLDGAEMPSQLI